MLNILTFINIALVLTAIVSGTKVLVGLLTGELFDKWAVLFLKCSLVASVAALLFQFHHLLPVQKASMLSVYTAGIAILAWRKYHLAGIWQPVFALSTAIVLYLNVLVAVTQILSHTQLPDGPAQLRPAFLVTQIFIAILFVGFGIRALKEFHGRPTHTL
jgi:hypothetical protein